MEKIAIISDTHGNEPSLKKALEIIKELEIKTIIHCGDTGGMDFLKENFSDFNLFVSLGNADFGEFEETENIKIFTEYGQLKNMAFCHFPDKARELAQSEKYDFVFYGHTHKPWEEKIKNCRMVNPGNLAGLVFRASFAILNKDKLELKII